MAHRLILAASAAACIAATMIGCGSKDNPVAPAAGDASISGPAGSTAVFSEGFGGDLSKWEQQFMINVGDYYPQMRITTAAFHTGTHSITSDTSQSALVHAFSGPMYTGIAGVQFYVMATAKGEANFTVQIGQNAGSSGGLGKAFGLGFDKTDSVTCIYYDYMGFTQRQDSAVAPMQVNHWYKCVVEVNFSDTTISYYLDDQKVRTRHDLLSDWNGIDRVLVFRGVNPEDLSAGTDHLAGPKPYYADDIVFYTK
jgi:hypothetical protein